MEGCGAFYVVKDPIKLLSVKVTLRRVIATGDDVVRAPPRAMESQQSIDFDDETEEIVFGWQEKVFSASEYEKYSNSANCKTVLEKQYHERITSNPSTVSRPTKRMFTYVDGDPFGVDLVYEMASMKVNEGKMAERIAAAGHRRTAPFSQLASLASSRNPVNEHPTADSMKKSRSIPYSVKTMYIMADFGEIGDEEQHVLTTIKLVNNEQLFISPDFTLIPYKVESRIGVFNYTLVNNSPTAVGADELTERGIGRSPAIHPRTSVDFDVPEDGCLRMLAVGEIVSAQHFEYDDVYIHYFVDLPPGWSLGDGLQPFGVTQRGKSSYYPEKGETIHYSCPFEFCMTYTLDPYRMEPDTLPEWPTFYLEAISEDSWGRFRSEGYAYFPFPNNSGHHDITVEMWRPIDVSDRFWELRRFFIGGGPELTNPINSRIANGSDPKHLSKYGHRTVTSGSVTVSLNIAKQCRVYQQRAAKRDQPAALEHRLFGPGRHGKVVAVLEAFQKARQRMIAVRESIYAEQDLMLA